jgi:hypothetical protein
MEKMELEPKYPDITVKLVGQDSNAFVLLGLINQALRKAKVPADIRGQFQTEATSGDYDNLLQTAMRWVNVE